MATPIYNSPNGGTNPSWISNINLENSTAGVPGFINISRHQCVGDSPEGLLRFKGGYDWSCTHYPYEQAVADAAGISITLDVSSPNLEKSLTGIDYVTKKEKIVTTVNGGMPLVKGLNGCDRTLGFRHPRTNQQDLKYLGIPGDDVNPLPSVYPGSRVDYWIHAIGSPMTDTPQAVKLGYIILRPNGSSKNPTPITQQGGMFYSQHSNVNADCQRLGLRGVYGGVFEIGEEFKEGDVLILTIGSDGDDNRVSISAKGPYGIGSMKNNAGQRMGTCIGNKNIPNKHCKCAGDPGCNRGAEYPWHECASSFGKRCGCHGTCDELYNRSTITSYGLLAPSSGKVNGVYREHYASWWHKNGQSHGGVGDGSCNGGVGGQPSFGAQNVNIAGLSVRIDITPKTRSRSDIGCLNTRDFDNSFGLYQQLWDHPESGSHIAKLVPYDYYEFPLRTSVNWYARECSLVVNEFNENVQNSIIYKSGCGSNLGDLPGDETFAGRAYDTKCVSYSMNISPKNNILTNTDKCCAPVISGPFLIEENKKGVRGERLNDSPNKDESLQPDISNYYNLKYMLENRVVCECQGTCRNHRDDQDDPVIIITDDTSIKSYTCDPSTYSCVGTTIEPDQLTHFAKYTDCSSKCARPDVCTSGCPCYEADGETRIYYLDNLNPCFFCCSGPLNGTQMFTVSPNMGDVGGGTAITITGQEFTGTTSEDPPITYTVDRIYLGTGDGEQTNLDWELVTSLNVISDKKLTCVTPPGTVGPKDIIMFTKDTVTGETLDQITKVEGFTYGISESLPAILSYSPNEGSVNGGTTLTIVGTNLTSADSVKVGGVACTNLTKTSTSITAKTPAGSLGTKSVAAHFTSPDTTLTLTPVFTYTNNTSVIDRISPTSGTQFGGTAITLYGPTTSDFSNINDVKIGGVSVSSFAVDPIFKYILRFTTPLKDTGYTIGTTPIVITNNSGSTASVNFSYVATNPSITSIDTLTSSLQVRQGQTINISGNNFINIDRVYLSYNSGATLQEGVCGFTVLSPTLMQIILPNVAGQDPRLTPPMTGVVNLVVLNKASISGAIGFTCYANPYITSFSPSNMGQGETQSATIRGFNFTYKGSPLPTAVLRNDTTGIEYSAYTNLNFGVNDTTISCTVNTTGIPAGRYTIVVKDPAGEASLSGFSVAMGAPTITGVEVWATDGSGVPIGRLYDGKTSQYMDTYSPTTPYASPSIHYLKVIGNNLDTTDPLFEFHIRSQIQIAGNTECGTDFKTWAPPNDQINKSYADPSGKFFFWKIETGRCLGSAKPTGGTFDVMDIKVISSGGSSQKLSAVKVVGYRPPFMSYIRNVGGGTSSPTPVSGQVTSWGGGNERVITVLDNNNFAIQRIILEPNLVSGDECKTTSYRSGVELLPCSDLTAQSVGIGCPGSRLGCFDYERTLPWSANYDPMYIHIHVPDFPSQTTMAKYWKDPLVYQFANINTSGKLLSGLSGGDTLLVSSVGSAW